MNFADKLVFLIKLTNSTNRKLADAISLDPSQISRLRCGVRKLPQGAEYLPAMAAYFVRLCQNDYQLAALAEQINGRAPALPIDRARLAEQLRFWLEREDAAPLPHPSGQRQFGQADAGDGRQPTPAERTHMMETFYGKAGQRQALDQLLESTLRRSRPTLLQVYSDQELSWQEEDDYSQNILPQRLLALLRMGCRFQRILRPTADLQYALAAIKLWMPIYLKGGVESFYYPCLRDRVYRRTLVVAQQVGAMVSTSIGMQSDSRLCHLFTEEPLVRHYSNEFNNYLSICKKIDTKYKDTDVKEYVSGIIAMAANMYKDDRPRQPTLPQDLSDQLLNLNYLPSPVTYPTYADHKKGGRPRLKLSRGSRQ